MHYIIFFNFMLETHTRTGVMKEKRKRNQFFIHSNLNIAHNSQISRIKSIYATRPHGHSATVSPFPHQNHKVPKQMPKTPMNDPYIADVLIRA